MHPDATWLHKPKPGGTGLKEEITDENASLFKQQIKTFRLMYVFLAGKIIRSARYVVMKLPAKYPYKDVYEKCLA